MPAHGKRRALGQHFLKDRKVISVIVDKTFELARKHGCKALLEIGPGKGAITRPLIDKFSEPTDRGTIEELILAERDRDLATRWGVEQSLSAFPGRSFPVRVEAGDFLELPEPSFLSRAPLMVVSNLPYSVGTAITTRLARHRSVIPAMVLMFQAEVAQRLRAEPGTKSWGSLSVWVQNYWDAERLLAVPPGAFIPPPDVNSEVLVLTARSKPHVLVTPEDEDLWQTLLRVSFAHRRKMLRSGLPKSGPWQNALELSGVDGTKRSEALGWDEWNKLFDALTRI